MVVSRYVVDAVQIIGLLVGACGGLCLASGLARCTGLAILQALVLIASFAILTVAALLALRASSSSRLVFSDGRTPLLLNRIELLSLQFLLAPLSWIQDLRSLSGTRLQLLGIVLLLLGVVAQLLPPVLDVVNIKIA